MTQIGRQTRMARVKGHIGRVAAAQFPGGVRGGGGGLLARLSSSL
jgi:hypothetical protein